MKAMILAAGRGERMRPLSDDCPKPLLKVAGCPLIVYHVRALAAAGVREIVINTAHLGEHLEQCLGDGQHEGVAIHYSREQAGGLGPAGGVINALNLLGNEAFLLLSGDIFTDYPFARLVQHQLSGVAHLVGVDNPPYHTEGDFYCTQHRVFLQPPSKGEAATRLTYGNIGVYDPALFARAPAGCRELTPLLHEAVAQGEVTVEHYRGVWENIGTPAQLAAVNQRVGESQ